MIRIVLGWMLCLPLLAAAAGSAGVHDWSDAERRVLESLALDALPPPPAAPSNRYADDPRAVALGRSLFFDRRFSANGQVACATCHPVNRNFADDLPLAHGLDTTARRAMPLIGMAYNTWYFWDGRKDSLWSQALAPIEDAREHGFTRTRAVATIAAHYREDYEAIFGRLPAAATASLPARARPARHDPAARAAWNGLSRAQRQAINRVYADMGKAIAAFVRTIRPTPSRFDRYVAAARARDRAAMARLLSPQEVAGLRLFIGRGRCLNCHSGPLFTNGSFHATGVPARPGHPPDPGRAAAIARVRDDPFNCLGRYSDADARECGALRFMDTDAKKYERAFKTPTLRNVAERAHYMHAGQFDSLAEVLRFYRDLPPTQRLPALGHGGLSDLDLARLEAFLRTLSAPLRYAGGRTP